MKNRKFLLIVSLVLAMTMSLGGTLAYLTDSDGDVNVMTVGRVEIKQNEQKRDGSAYEDQMLLPIVGSAGNKDEAGYPKAANYIDKIVTVTNTGNTAAWVRTLIAFPNVTYQPDHDSADASTEVIHWNGYSQGDEKIEKYKIAGIIPGKEGTVANNWVWGTEENGVVWPGNAETWNWVQNVMIDGKPYIVYIATNLEEVASQETTAPNMIGLYLDEGVDYDNDNGYYTYDNKPIAYTNHTEADPKYMTAGDVKVYVLSQAVQASGFNNAWAAFDAAFPLTEKDADGKVTKNEQEVVGEWFATMTKDTTGADNVPPVFEDPKPANGDDDSVTYPIPEGTEYTTVSNSEELKAALNNKAATILLKNGEYNWSGTGHNGTAQSVTIYGESKNAILYHTFEGEGNTDYDFDGYTVNFYGLTISGEKNGASYPGWARMSATYNDCVIKQTYGLYAGTHMFNYCTFNVSGDQYNLWTWGAENATFNNCTFNSDGKAVLLYGQANTKLTLDSCLFNDNGGLSDLKAAVEIGNDYGKSYELIVNNTTVNGYEINDKGINTGSTLWGNKNSMGTDKLNVVVDGVDVY